VPIRSHHGTKVLFPTVRFALFFCLVLPTSWLLMPRLGRWKAFVLVASFVFYGAWDWRYTFLLAASIVANQIFAVGIQRRIDDDGGRRRWTALAVATNLATLGWFKYAGFLGESAGGLMGALGIDWEPPVPDVLLPIGISFFTFQALSYVIDVSRRRIHPSTLLDFAVYLSFFPHLVAGPIVRASEFLPQLKTRRNPRKVQASLALWLIAGGLVKKVVVANYLATEIVDPLFAVPADHGGFVALLGVYAYAIQIYADFSGYTDMAIGLALLMGFQFPQNFDAPYTAASLQDFWHRWHMTLSRWLRDYLYISLGGNRRGRARTYANLIITMLLGGLWHGAAWTFVIWGLLHGVGLAVERWLDERRGRREPPPEPPAEPATGPRPATARADGGGDLLLAEVEAEVDAEAAVDDEPRVELSPPRHVWLRRFLTFQFVCLGWIFFRADSTDTAFEIIGNIVGGSSDDAVNWVVVGLVAAMLVSQFVPAGTVGRLRTRLARLPLPLQAAGLAAVVLLVDVFGPEGIAPFIYFQF
jgi:D-alanyl-lipoteichoic acid acyltransferase DltB (MBOAT superfamily)